MENEKANPRAMELIDEAVMKWLDGPETIEEFCEWLIKRTLDAEGAPQSAATVNERVVAALRKAVAASPFRPRSPRAQKRKPRFNEIKLQIRSMTLSHLLLLQKLCCVGCAAAALRQSSQKQKYFSGQFAGQNR